MTAATAAAGREATPWGPHLWNSNAYAICGKCENKIKRKEKALQIMHLQFEVAANGAWRAVHCVMGVTVEQSRLRR
jgi:hypothetical protein